MTVRAIETWWNGIRYRSRLEARWGCFMELVGWADHVQYEPIDLQGYIPDFIVCTPGNRPFLLEVKPALDFNDLSNLGTKKIEQSGWQHDALVVGTRPLWGSFDSSFWGGDNALGLLGEYVPEDRYFSWAPAAVGICGCGDDWRMDFCHPYQSFRHRFCGGYDGSCLRCEAGDAELIHGAWKMAGDATRWQANRKGTRFIVEQDET